MNKRNILLSLFIVCMLLTFVAGCTQSNKSSSGKVSQSTASSSQTSSKGEVSQSQTPSSTPSQTLTPSQLKEQLKNQKPGKCLILDDNFSKYVKIISKNGHKIAVANLPQGTMLFSPVAGLYNNTDCFHSPGEKNQALWDFGAMVKSAGKDGITYVFIYSKKSERNFKGSGDIKKGDQIGTLNNIDLKYFVSGYNFAFYMYQPNMNGDDLLLKMFPNN